MRELEVFRKYLAKNKLQENEPNEDGVRDYLAKAFNISPDEVALSPEEAKSPTNANEVAIATAFTILGLIPIIVGGIGSILNKINQKFGLSDNEKAELEKLNIQIESKKAELKNVNKQDSTYSDSEKNLEKEIKELEEEKEKRFGSKLGSIFKGAAHEIHETYLGPIKLVLKGIAWTADKFGKKIKIQDEAYRDKIAEIIYAVVMISAAGAGVASHLSHLTSIQPILTTIVELAKGGKSVGDILKAVITVI